MSDVVYLNSSMVDRSEARIKVQDYGFLYGFGLFETMRAYGGKVFRLGRHLERLGRSAEMLRIAVDRSLLAEAITGTIQANDLMEARIRLTVSIGEGDTVPDPASCGEPTILVVAGQYHPFPPEVYEKGFRSIVSSVRRTSTSLLSSMKTLNYLESMLARQEARAAGVDEAICLNERGLLAEASMSNLFLVKGGTLKTPGIGSGILPGVTREAVLEIALEQDISTAEDDITFREFLDVDEAFLTNSIMEVMPLTEVDGKPVGSGMPGEVTRKLMAAYKKLVEREAG